MAKSTINTKSSSYQRDKEAFLKELKQFNDSKGIPYKVPKVNAIEIDLYHFYTLVQQKGGVHKVNQSDTWDSFLRPLRLPHPCINGSTLLKRIYSMYLEKYERAKGPPGRDDDNDVDDDPRRTRGGGMPRVTFSGGTYISGDAHKCTPSHTQDKAPNETNAPTKHAPNSQADTNVTIDELTKGLAAIPNRKVKAKQRHASATLPAIFKAITSKERKVSSASIRTTSDLNSIKESESLPNRSVSATRQAFTANRSNSVKTETTKQKSESDTIDINTLVRRHRMLCLERPRRRDDSPLKFIVKPREPEPLPPKVVVFPKPPIAPKKPESNSQEVKATQRKKSAFSKKHYSKRISKF